MRHLSSKSRAAVKHYGLANCLEAERLYRTRPAWLVRYHLPRFRSITQVMCAVRAGREVWSGTERQLFKVVWGHSGPFLAAWDS